MFVVNHLKSVALSLSLLFLHSLEAAAVGESSLEPPAKMIHSLASEVHNIARSSTAKMDSRLTDLEHKINMLQALLDTQKLEASHRRYILLLECFAWDLYETLLQYENSMFAMEGTFKRQRPSIDVAVKCVLSVITHDIKNIALKQILSEMSIATASKDRKNYDALADQLASLEQTLSETEKKEFDIYRMILGPQIITVPY